MSTLNWQRIVTSHLTKIDNAPRKTKPWIWFCLPCLHNAKHYDCTQLCWTLQSAQPDSSVLLCRYHITQYWAQQLQVVRVGWGALQLSSYWSSCSIPSGYPQGTLTVTATWSSHSGIALYETYISGQRNLDVLWVCLHCCAVEVEVYHQEFQMSTFDQYDNMQ